MSLCWEVKTFDRLGTPVNRIKTTLIRREAAKKKTKDVSFPSTELDGGVRSI
jgi:hypothetical protein